MLNRIFLLFLFLVSTAPFLCGQDCKLKFSVVYTDGKDLQLGLTPEQKKMWDRDSSKKFKGMCVDEKAPDYIILWNEGLNGSELAKASIDHANVVLSTGQNPTTTTAQSSVTSAYHYVRPSSLVRGKANYSVLDTSKKPYVMVHQGEGYQDIPRDVRTGIDKSVNASDVTSTIPDPVDALESALKWLKKEKKL